MKSSQHNQYTIRNLPPELDKTLRQKAKKSGKSLNAIVLESLARGAGLSGKPAIYRDLSFMAGSWVDDPEFDKAMEDFERIDEECWK